MKLHKRWRQMIACSLLFHFLLSSCSAENDGPPQRTEAADPTHLSSYSEPEDQPQPSSEAPSDASEHAEIPDLLKLDSKPAQTQVQALDYWEPLLPRLVQYYAPSGGAVWTVPVELYAAQDVLVYLEGESLYLTVAFYESEEQYPNVPSSAVRYSMRWETEAEGYRIVDAQEVPPQYLSEPSSGSFIPLDDLEELQPLASGDANRFGYGDGRTASVVCWEDTVFSIQGQDAGIKISTLDLLTLEQRIGQYTYHFAEDELLVKIQCEDIGILVYTTQRSILFDYKLDVLAQKSWPQQLLNAYPHWDKENIVQGAVVNGALTQAAFSGGGDLYLYDMEDAVAPVLLAEADEAQPANEKLPFPERYLPGDRLLIGLHSWEGTAGYQILDFHGNILLDKTDLWISYEHSGGYFFRNSAGGMYFGTDYQVMESGEALYTDRHGYHDFDSLDEKLFVSPYFGAYANCVYNLSSPRVWYVSNAEVRAWFYDRTSFYCINGVTGEVAELPFTLSGTEGTVLAAGTSGRLLFSYRMWGERRYCVYLPEEMPA